MTCIVITVDLEFPCGLKKMKRYAWFVSWSLVHFICWCYYEYNKASRWMWYLGPPNKMSLNLDEFPVASPDNGLLKLMAIATVWHFFLFPGENMTMPGRSCYLYFVFINCPSRPILAWHDYSNSSNFHAESHIESHMHLATGAEESPLILDGSSTGMGEGCRCYVAHGALQLSTIYTINTQHLNAMIDQI